MYLRLLILNYGANPNIFCNFARNIVKQEHGTEKTK